MKKTIFILLFFSSISIFSQEKELKKSTLPTSIYASAIYFNDSNSFIDFNKKLNIYNQKFLNISYNDIDRGHFIINDNNLSNKADIYIFEDYKGYRDEYLLKGFFEKYDLTRWQPCNFIAPSIN